MSDRLTISAALSVLVMSIYVLFGADTARIPFASGLGSPVNISAPQVSIKVGALLPLAR